MRKIVIIKRTKQSKLHDHNGEFEGEDMDGPDDAAWREAMVNMFPPDIDRAEADEEGQS